MYPSTVIPDKNEVFSASLNKKNYRPNNFMSEATGFVKGKRLGSVGGAGGIGAGYEDEEEQLEIELTGTNKLVV